MSGQSHGGQVLGRSSRGDSLAKPHLSGLSTSFHQRVWNLWAYKALCRRQSQRPGPASTLGSRPAGIYLLFLDERDAQQGQHDSVDGKGAEGSEGPVGSCGL